VVTSKVSLNGSIPAYLNEAITVPQTAGTILNMVEYFAVVRSPEDCGAEEGLHLGFIVVQKLSPFANSPFELRDAIDDLISNVKVLRECQRMRRFLDEIIFYLVRNKIERQPFVVNVTLSQLTSHQAGLIARSFSTMLLVSVSPEAAVWEWTRAYPALQEYELEFPWFSKMIEGMGRQLVKKTTLGLRVRSSAGAGLSILDMVTDAYIAARFLVEGNAEFAYYLMSLIAVGIILQIIIVLVSNHGVTRNKWKRIGKEVLYVLTFVKPGVDAHRVISGAIQQEGSSMPPLQELSSCKLVELVVEAVPGLLIQSLALIRSERKSKVAILSMIISAGSAAMTSAQISYDYDTNPRKRIVSPEMYGMVPDDGRVLSFIIMFTLSGLQIMSRCFSLALLYVTNPAWLMYYITVDFSIYFTQKLARNDFIYTLPLPLAPSIFISFFVRIITKVTVDFTGSFHFRNPYELGGIYWSWTLVVCWASVVACVYLYNDFAEQSAAKIDAGVLWMLCTVCLFAWLSIFIFFVARVMVPKFHKTLVSFRTGREKSESFFLDNTEDADRIAVFRDNKVLWRRIRGDVKAWSLANWDRWAVEKPPWFTPGLISTIPDEFISPGHLSELGSDRKRRGSAK
jgi:hypothetical protein